MAQKMLPKNKANRSSKKLTSAQYIEKLRLVNINIECCEEYINARIPISHKCLVCGNIWKASPYHVLNGTGCPLCAKDKISRANRISHEQFIQNLNGRLNPYVKVVGKYINSHTKVECECLLCGRTLWIAPTNLYWGKGCPSCMNRLNNPNKTHEKFVDEMKSVNPNIEIIGLYVGAREQVACRCMKCGFEWNGVPTNLLRGVGCPDCALLDRWESRRPTTEQYSERLKLKSSSIIALEDYIDATTPILHQCLICNYQWKVSPHGALQHTIGCPKCSGSYGEQKILAYLLSHNYDYVFQKTYNDLVGVKGGLLSYDFYLPEFNLLIEFQGEQHIHAIDIFGGQEKFEIQKEHDRRKYEYAFSHNIRLLEIWYYDYDKVEDILNEQLNLESVETETVV